MNWRRTKRNVHRACGAFCRASCVGFVCWPSNPSTEEDVTASVSSSQQTVWSWLNPQLCWFYMRGNHKSGAVDLSWFAIYRSQAWKMGFLEHDVGNYLSSCINLRTVSWMRRVEINIIQVVQWLVPEWNIFLVEFVSKQLLVSVSGVSVLCCLVLVCWIFWTWSKCFGHWKCLDACRSAGPVSRLNQIVRSR